MKSGRERIRSLDGLRCLSVLAVIAFHYGAMWPQHYPYADEFVHTPLQWGYFGVHMFFAVSGYVIALTLDRCHSLGEFVARRFARLWPTMALCALLTYCVMSLAPGTFGTSAAGFLPSLTFIAPEAFNRVFGTDEYRWIDGAYWSLFVEVRFYALAGVLYFAQPKQFVRNVAIISAAIIAAYLVTLALQARAVVSTLVIFGIADYLPWFLIGIAAYSRKPVLAYGAIVGLLLQAWVSDNTALAIAAITIPAIMWAVLSVAPIGRILSMPWIAGIGVSSYSLYLLHQYIGVTLISYGRDDWAYVLPFVVTGIMVYVSRLIHVYFEEPANRAVLKALHQRDAQDRVRQIELG